MSEVMASSDLRPCPFCGCARILSKATSPIPFVTRWKVTCLSCGASTDGDVDFGKAGTPEEMKARAEERWNRRVRA